MTEIPRYRCIKKVRALEINMITSDDVMFFEIADGHRPIKAAPDLFARYRPQAGDFLVFYDDGYMSISPRKAFLEGYVRDEDDKPAGMDPERRARIALVWRAALRSGAWEVLWRRGRFEAFLPPPEPLPLPLNEDPQIAAVTMERITFELGTPRGSPQYSGVPVLCEGEKFGVINPP